MKIRNVVFGLFASLIVLSSCEKKDIEEPIRLFRPVLSGTLIADSNAIQAAWANIRQAESFTLQLSRDSFRTIERTITVDTNRVSITNLRWDQLYQLQVRANAPDTAFNSRWSPLGAIRTPKFPSVLKAPTLADFTDEAIKVSWNTSADPLTSIRVLSSPDSTLVRTVPVTSADVNAGFKIISGLRPGTTYIIMVYSGSRLRGYDNYTTLPAAGANTVDLRGITGRPSVLSDTLPTLESGSTVLLQRGETYNIASTVLLTKSVTIKSGADISNPAQAVLYFTSNFNFGAGSNIQNIEFDDVMLMSDNYTSRYVFNTTNSANVGKLSFTNCRVSIFRGMVRLQSGTTTINDFIINRCIIDSISNYGVITVDNVSCRADNISITNSTIYKTEKIITSRQNSTSVVMENLTINETPLSTAATANYFIDYSTAGTNNVTNGVRFANNILGIAKNFATTGARGIRVGTSTSIVAVNNYATSEYVEFATTPAAIPDLIRYPKKSTELWQDPANGNFRIIDMAFAGRNTAGDPRWRP